MASKKIAMLNAPTTYLQERSNKLAGLTTRKVVFICPPMVEFGTALLRHCSFLILTYLVAVVWI